MWAGSLSLLCPHHRASLIGYNSSRMGVSIKLLSALFFSAFFISHICFARVTTDVAYYVPVNGCLLVVYLVLLYKTSRLRAS